MASYIQEALGRDEHIAATAEITGWVWFIPVVLTIVTFGILCPILLIPLIRQWTTDLGVTNRRVIAKFGLIARHTTEQRLEKIESIRIEQGILGRILGFGTVRIHGTGGATTPFALVADPLGFKRAIESATDELTSPSIPAWDHRRGYMPEPPYRGEGSPHGQRAIDGVHGTLYESASHRFAREQGVDVTEHRGAAPVNHSSLSGGSDSYATSPPHLMGTRVGDAHVDPGAARRLTRREPSDSTWASAFDDVPPWEPRSPAEMWRNLSRSSKIVVAIVIIILVVLITTSSTDHVAELEPTVQYVDGSGKAVSAREPRQAPALAAKLLRPVSKESDWVGKYDGAFDGASGTLDITQGSDQKLSISLGMAGGSCAGGIDAVVDQPAGNIITITKAPYEDGDYQESTCRLSLHKRGDEIVLHEDEVCMNHHGMSCGFNGSADLVSARGQ